MVDGPATCAVEQPEAFVKAGGDFSHEHAHRHLVSPRPLVLAASAPVPVEHHAAHGSAPVAARGPPLAGDLFVTASRPPRRRHSAASILGRGCLCFNHHEARATFREGVRFDPGMAMCYWGIASTRAELQRPTTPGEKRALDAIRRRSGWRRRRPGARAQPGARKGIRRSRRHARDSRPGEPSRAWRAGSSTNDPRGRDVLAESMMLLRPWAVVGGPTARESGPKERAEARARAREEPSTRGHHLYPRVESEQPGAPQAAAPIGQEDVHGAGYRTAVEHYWRVGRSQKRWRRTWGRGGRRRVLQEAKRAPLRRRATSQTSTSSGSRPPSGPAARHDQGTRRKFAAPCRRT